MGPSSGFSRFTLGGNGSVDHKLGIDITNGTTKWTLKFKCSGTKAVQQAPVGDNNMSPPRAASSSSSSSTRSGGSSSSRNGGGSSSSSVGSGTQQAPIDQLAAGGQLQIVDRDPIVLRSSGAMARVHGRIRNIKTNKERAFVVSIDDAKKTTLDVTDLATDRSSVSDLFDQTSPAGFWRILIKASGFAELGVPQIASIGIEAICADKPTKAVCNIPENAVLIRGTIFFAPNTDKEEELLVDHIILLDADLFLPSEELAPLPPPLKAAIAAGDRVPVPVQSPGRINSTGGLFRMAKMDDNANILPVGSHRQRTNYLGWLFSTLGMLTSFIVFIAWALTYTAAVTKNEAVYGALVIFGAYASFIIILKITARLAQQPVFNSRSMFVNSYNAWGFCGTLIQSERIPMYAMPHSFVRAFHDGSPSLDINLGHHRKTSKLSLASDMFTVLADRGSRVCLVLGFLSQREQFGCVATNDAYDCLSVRCTCDGVTIRPGSSPPPPHHGLVLHSGSQGH